VRCKRTLSSWRVLHQCIRPLLEHWLPAIIQVGDTYNDLGATITGPQADLNLGIQTFVNGVATSPVQIDTSEAATDTIDYVATDQNGLTSTSTRTVIIEAPSIVPSDDASTMAATTTDATTTAQ
jgi:Domain of unknown function (DUF5011)